MITRGKKERREPLTKGRTGGWHRVFLVSSFPGVGIITVSRIENRLSGGFNLFPRA